MRFRQDVLREARLELGLTQEELAATLGVDVRTYRRYESGKVNEAGRGFTVRHPTRRRLLERMCAELGLEHATLIEREPSGAGRLVHTLQPARFFVGRAAELARLTAFRASRAPGVLAIVGLGGSGKTALIERFLARSGDAGALVYSFYDDPSVERFLTEAAAMSDVPEPLFVLDGLETHQVVFEDARAYGEIRSPQLRRWLCSQADGRGAAQVIVTTRLPLVDVDAFTGRGYEMLALTPLADDETRELLQAWGIEAPPPDLGGHALFVSMLGSYVGRFLEGDTAAIESLDLRRASQDDRLARRLRSVLRSYRAALPADTAQMLERLSIFHASVPSDELLRSPDDAVQLRRLERLGLVFRRSDGRCSTHPFIADYFRASMGEARVRAEHDRHREALEARLDVAPGAFPHTATALEQLEALIAHTLGAARPSRAALLYQRVLGGFPHLGMRLGEYARGQRILRGFDTRGGPPEGLGSSAWNTLRYEAGLYASTLGELDEALRRYDEARGGAKDRPTMEATCLRARAYTLRLMGDLDAARDAVDASAAIATRAGERSHHARALALGAAIAGDRGDLDAARALFRTSESIGGRLLARRSLWAAELELWHGEPALARAMTEPNLAHCEALGWGGHVAHCEIVLGFVALRDGASDPRGHLERARAWTEQSGEVELQLRADALEHGIDRGEPARRRGLARLERYGMHGLRRWFAPSGGASLE